MEADKVSSTAQMHYPSLDERRADRTIHWIGLAAALVAGPILIGVAYSHGGVGRAAAIAVYVGCLALMLGVSSAYNLATSFRWQRRLRRLDHAAIFLMIAGSYTPFTTQRLEGLWALSMTAAVWALALLCAAGKLLLPGVSRRLWIIAYVALGWMVLGAARPLSENLGGVAITLLATGGVIYTFGSVLYASPALPYRRAIWHSLVLIAAGTHYAAIMIGVALPN